MLAYNPNVDLPFSTKGVQIGKIWGRDEMMPKIEVEIVASFGLSYVVANRLAPEAYDAFTERFETLPPNAGVVACFLRSSYGKSWFATLGKDMLAVEPALMGEPSITTTSPLPKVMYTEGLPPREQLRLNDVVRTARQDYLLSSRFWQQRDESLLEAALANVIATCQRHGLKEFVMPYANVHKKASTGFVGALKAAQRAEPPRLPWFRLNWAPDGLVDEVY